MSVPGVIPRIDRVKLSYCMERTQAKNGEVNLRIETRGCSLISTSLRYLLNALELPVCILRAFIGFDVVSCRVGWYSFGSRSSRGFLKVEHVEIGVMA